MNLIYSFIIWGVMALVIGCGLLLAAKGSSLWLLILSLAAFVFLVGKIGCATH